MDNKACGGRAVDVNRQVDGSLERNTTQVRLGALVGCTDDDKDVLVSRKTRQESTRDQNMLHPQQTEYLNLHVSTFWSFNPQSERWKRGEEK